MISPEGGKSEGWQRETGKLSFNSENFYNHFQNKDILNGVADYQSPMISVTLRRLAITHISDFMIHGIIKTRDCNLTPIFWGHCTATAGFGSTHSQTNGCTSFLTLFYNACLAIRYMVWCEEGVYFSSTPNVEMFLSYLSVFPATIPCNVVYLLRHICIVFAVDHWMPLEKALLKLLPLFFHQTHLPILVELQLSLCELCSLCLLRT